MTDTLLWVVLAVAAVANIALSASGSEVLSIPSGVVVLGCGIALTIRHFDRKRG